VAIALGGDYLANVAVLRNSPEVLGPVASDPTISRPIHALAEAGPKVLRLIGGARVAAREHVWKVAGAAAPGTGGAPIPLDLDATIVIALHRCGRPPVHLLCHRHPPPWRPQPARRPGTAVPPTGPL
jgi:hypothetical protein